MAPVYLAWLREEEEEEEEEEDTEGREEATGGERGEDRSQYQMKGEENGRGLERIEREEE